MAQVFTSVSGQTVSIKVVITSSDITLTGSDKWEVVISAKTNHGLGSTGSPDYPYYVDNILGNGSTTFTRTLIADKYVAEIAITGQGPVDYSMFEIVVYVPPITPVLTSINIPSSAKVEVGKSINLIATCKDQNGNNMACPLLKWGSSTTNAVVDNNGIVTGKSAGTVLINCWDAATTKIVSNICSVTIIPPICTNPKYKCFGATCISDNCDGSGTFTTPDCNNTCTCPDQGSKCDTGGNQCYYNVKTCTFDCQPCPSGSECQMQSGLAKCVSVAPVGADVKVLTISQDDLTKPYMRTAGVSGTGTGTFTIKEGSTVIATGTMTNGWGLVDIDNIPVGNHTYCAIPSTSSVCDTFTVGTPVPFDKWGCSDDCSVAHEFGVYNSQQECQTGCKIPPPPPPSVCTNPKYTCIAGICASDDCDGTGTFPDETCGGGCAGDGGGNGGTGTGAGILGSITIDKTVSVQVGKTVTLTAICKDTNGNAMVCPSLIWQSNDESIAKISAGVITGVSVGETTITARDNITSQVSNAGIATIVTVKTGNTLSDWLQTTTCFDNTNKKYCAKNWMLGAGVGVALILLARKK